MNLNIKNEIHTKPYLPTLTPLRGIAAICVVMHHSSLFFGSFIPHSVTYFFENSWIWVDFFFILSGFILSYAYGSYFKESVTLTAYKKYIVARFARIYPLHLVTLLWAFAVVAGIVLMATSIDNVIRDQYNLKALLPCLLLMQDMHLYKLSPLNFPSWSLSAEWWMYLFFPFLVPYFSRLSKIKTAFTLLLIIAAYVVMRDTLGPISGSPVVHKPTINISADFGMLRCLSSFCTGVLLFAFYEGRIGYAIFRNSWCFIFFFSLVLFAIHAGVTDILIIALFPFVLLTAAYNETAIKKIFNTQILQRLGDWSFSIYMVHGPIILMLLARSVYKDPALLSNVTLSTIKDGDQEVGRTFDNYRISLLYCCIILIATLMVSAFTYRFVEIPAGKYLKRIFKTKHVTMDIESMQR